MSQGGAAHAARGKGIGRGRHTLAASPQREGPEPGTAPSLATGAVCNAGERERDRWLCGVEYPDTSGGLAAGRTVRAHAPPDGVGTPAVLKCRSKPAGRQRADPVDLERLACPKPVPISSRGGGPHCLGRPEGAAAALGAGTAPGAGAATGQAAGGAAAAAGPGTTPGSIATSNAPDWATTVAAKALKAAGSPIGQPSLVAISLRTAKKAPACMVGPEATGCGPAPSTWRETRVSWASAKAATATASRVAASSTWATKAECSVSARLNSFSAWVCRVTAVWSRSEWVRPDSIVDLAALTAALASASPCTAGGKSGWSLSIRSQERTIDLAAFRAASAGDWTLGSTAEAGGAAGAAAALAERTATCAGERCEGVEGWEASGLPNPLVALQRLHVLWNAQLVLNPQLQAHTGSLDFAGRPTAGGPGGGAAARRGAIAEQQEDDGERNRGGLRTACLGECG